MKNIFSKIVKKVKKMLNTKKDILYLSFGENCLTDNILERYHIKSFSTPYSSGRSNIEYILQIEKDNFKNFLNTNFMKHDFFDEKKVVRLTTYNNIRNTYNKSCINGFEFTHHDLLEQSKLRETMERRCNRLKNLRDKKICIFYHNRYGGNTDENILINDLLELKEIYSERCKEVNIFMFKQQIIMSKENRRVEYQNKKGIFTYTFYTLNSWEGKNQDIFWAKCDDDLIKIMIKDAKKIYK